MRIKGILHWPPVSPKVLGSTRYQQPSFIGYGQRYPNIRVVSSRQYCCDSKRDSDDTCHSPSVTSFSEDHSNPPAKRLHYRLPIFFRHQSRLESILGFNGISHWLQAQEYRQPNTVSSVSYLLMVIPRDTSIL